MKRAVWLLILLPLLAAWPAHADPAAAPAVASDRFTEMPIHRDGDSAAALPATNPTAPANPIGNPTDLDLPRVMISLATVVALIFGLRWLSRKMFPTAARASNPSAVRILARSPISPRQRILLLQVGRRVLIVGDTGGNLSSLGQITDADEIAALIAQSKPVASGRNPVTAPFNRPQKGDAAPADDASLQAAELELAGLSQRIRAMARELK